MVLRIYAVEDDVFDRRNIASPNQLCFQSEFVAEPNPDGSWRIVKSLHTPTPDGPVPLEEVFIALEHFLARRSKKCQGQSESASS